MSLHCGFLQSSVLKVQTPHNWLIGMCLGMSRYQELSAAERYSHAVGRASCTHLLRSQRFQTGAFHTAFASTSVLAMCIRIWAAKDAVSLIVVLHCLQSGRTFLDPEEKLRRIAMQKEQAAAGGGGATSVSSEEARRAAINAEAEVERLAAAKAKANASSGMDNAAAAARPMTPND